MKQPGRRLFHISFATAIILLLALLAFVLPPFVAYREQQRAPASTPKWGVLKPQTEPRWQQGKANSAFAIEMVQSEGQVIEAGIPFTVTANIKANIASEEVQWDWVIPQGMHVIAGETHGTASNIARDQIITTELQVVVDNNDNQLVHLHAYESASEQPQSTIGHFATRPTTYVYQESKSSTGNQKVVAESAPVNKPRLMQ